MRENGEYGNNQNVKQKHANNSISTVLCAIHFVLKFSNSGWNQQSSTKNNNPMKNGLYVTLATKVVFKWPINNALLPFRFSAILLLKFNN